MQDDPPRFCGPPGDSVPVVDSSDLKAAWGVYHDLKESHPEGRVGVSTSVIEHACRPGADIRAVTYRSGMLGLLLIVPGELLGPWQQGETLSEIVFKVAARIRWSGWRLALSDRAFRLMWMRFCRSCATGSARQMMANASSSY